MNSTPYLKVQKVTCSDKGDSNFSYVFHILVELCDVNHTTLSGRIIPLKIKVNKHGVDSCLEFRIDVFESKLFEHGYACMKISLNCNTDDQIVITISADLDACAANDDIAPCVVNCKIKNSDYCCYDVEIVPSLVDESSQQRKRMKVTELNQRHIFTEWTQTTKQIQKDTAVNNLPVASTSSESSQYRQQQFGHIYYVHKDCAMKNGKIFGLSCFNKDLKLVMFYSQSDDKEVLSNIVEPCRRPDATEEQYLDALNKYKKCTNLLETMAQQSIMSNDNKMVCIPTDPEVDFDKYLEDDSVHSNSLSNDDYLKTIQLPSARNLSNLPILRYPNKKTMFCHKLLRQFWENACQYSKITHLDQ